MALSRAFGALVLLAALVVGVPYLLVSIVGNPFPSEVPTFDEIRILLTQNGEGFARFIRSTLAVFIWIIWAQLMLALVVEVAATIRHTETRRLPTAPGLQFFVARLVATITLATTLAAGPTFAPAIGALTFDDHMATTPATSMIYEAETPRLGAAAHQVDVAGLAQPSPRQSETGEADALSRVSDDQTTARLVVHDRTELWDLAEAAYGDGVSWKLIALSNAGVADASGQMITHESELVAAGTELLLPGAIDTEAASAFGTFVSGPTEAPVGASVEMTHTVEVGDSMWSVAESEVEHRLDRTATTAEVADYWVDVVAANPSMQSGNADLIYPGERLVMPGRVAPASSEIPADMAPTTPVDTPGDPAAPAASALESVAATPTMPEVEASSRSVAALDVGDEAPSDETEMPPEVEVRATSDRSISLPAGGLAALGTGILSAGVVGAVRRRRDLQRRTRPSGTIPRAPSTEAAAFEAAMIHASHDLRESRNGLGWRVLPASAVHAFRAPDPHPHATMATAGAAGEQPTVLPPRRIDIEPPNNTAPPETPPAAEVPSDSSVREADAAGQQTVESDAAAEAVSAADTGGDTAQTDAAYTDTADTPEITELAPAATSIVVGTDPATNEAVLLDLAAAGTVALGGDDLAVHMFARSVVLDLAVSERANDLCVIAVGLGEELEDLERVRVVGSYSDALTQAVRCGHVTTDSATPVIVVSDIRVAASDEAPQALRDLGAIVVAPGIDAEVSVAIDGDSAVLSPTGSTVTLAALDDDAFRAVAELIDNTSCSSVELADASVPVEAIIDVAATADCVVAEGPIDVKILGPVEITGAESFSSLKAIDVITYLAFHRHGVDADQIKTWVWPTFEPPTDKAFANVMSRARTGLGADADGSPFLSRAGADKTYRLAEAVTTDFDRFRATVEQADAATDAAETLELLAQALELIRGVPFTGGAASSFAWADNHVRARVEFTIDETVHRCADLALEADDLARARWAALKGLELVPGCEQCFKRRFLVAGAGNNRSELRRAMADLEASAMADLGEPEALDVISGELLDLYHELDRALVSGSAGVRS